MIRKTLFVAGLLTASLFACGTASAQRVVVGVRPGIVARPAVAAYRVATAPVRAAGAVAAYRAPIYYSAPVYSTPVYSAPVYSAPVYAAPVSVYRPPIYSYPSSGISVGVNIGTPVYGYRYGY
jgi:hypothetical protein